jgi:hypothetical protein
MSKILRGIAISAGIAFWVVIIVYVLLTLGSPQKDYIGQTVILVDGGPNSVVVKFNVYEQDEESPNLWGRLFLVLPSSVHIYWVWSDIQNPCRFSVTMLLDGAITTFHTEACYKWERWTLMPSRPIILEKRTE